MGKKGKGKNKGKGKGASGSGGGKKQQPGKYAVILMGFPGSGKSTFAAKLKKNCFEVCSSDALGAPAQKKLVEKTIRQGQKICVIDSCNCHPKDRKMWASQYAKEQQVIVVWFDSSAEVCKQRAGARSSHPTLGPDEAPSVIDRFAQGFKAPPEHERKQYALFIVESEGDAVKKLTDFVGL